MKILFNIIFLFAIVTPTIAQINDWPIFRGRTSLSGVSDFEIGSTPSLLWNVATGARTKSSPVLSDNTLFFGNERGILTAVSADGRIKWTSDIGNAAPAPPLVFSGNVIIGSANGTLSAFNKETGRLNWTYKTGGQISGSANIWQSGSRAVIVVGSYDYYLHCVDPATGKPLWKLETLNYVNGTPAIFGDRIIFGGCDGFLRQVNPATGQETSAIDIDAYIAASAAISVGKAFLGDLDGILYSIDINSGNVDWKTNASENGEQINATPAVGYGYVVIGSEDKYLYCFDSRTGKQLWKFRTNGQISGSAVITPTKVLFGSSDGNIHLLNLPTAEEFGGFNAGAPISSSPIVTRDRFYFLAEDGRLLAFRSN
jgi:outer membrane protein assembly factor BamB